MAVNKVVINNAVELDLTADTVSSDKLVSGYTAHDKAGSLITGSLTLPNGTITVTANGEYDVAAFTSCVVSIPEYDGTVI